MFRHFACRLCLCLCFNSLCMLACVRLRMYANVCVCECMCIRMYVCACMRMSLCASMCVSLCTHACVYIIYRSHWKCDVLVTMWRHNESVRISDVPSFRGGVRKLFVFFKSKWKNIPRSEIQWVWVCMSMRVCVCFCLPVSVRTCICAWHLCACVCICVCVSLYVYVWFACLCVLRTLVWRRGELHQVFGMTDTQTARNCALNYKMIPPTVTPNGYVSQFIYILKFLT